MNESKKRFVAGLLILLIALVTGALIIVRLMGIGYAQGEVVGSITDEDGTTMLLVNIEVEGMQYTLPVPEDTWDGSAAYDKKDPSGYANVEKMKLQLLTLALPELILGLTLILSNIKADSSDDDKVEKE